MTDSALAQTIKQRIEAVKKVVDLLAQAGRGDDLHDLRVLLINTMGLLKRDPGTEAAVDDLYAAAAAVVRDSSSGPSPGRSRRFLVSACDRFCGRVMAAAGWSDAAPAARFTGLAAAYAVQLERVAWQGALDPVGRAA